MRRFQHYLEGTHEGLVDAHHAACVVELATVIWSREKCDQLAFGKELVSILHNLRRYTKCYRAAYRDRYQERDLRLGLQAHAAVDVYCTKPPTAESNKTPKASLNSHNHQQSCSLLSLVSIFPL